MHKALVLMQNSHKTIQDILTKCLPREVDGHAWPVLQPSHVLAPAKANVPLPQARGIDVVLLGHAEPAWHKVHWLLPSRLKLPTPHATASTAA